ncbi:MAG: sulfotransferase [Betaproteobacteria bacterium HGW-Betaproteobacteria-10]|nr:MAG: sulfotransferase [Betaproteobacteria bacterium HGW-Betaproteobacteria-10]
MVAQIDRHYFATRPLRLWSRLLAYGLFEGRPLTTRGRWINPLIFAHCRLSALMPQMKRVNAPIFILGTGRSGTTILGVVLSMHRDIGFLNEPKALWHAAHGGEDLIGSYDRGEARYRLGGDDASVEVQRKMHHSFGLYLRLSGARRLLDKYPELIFRVPFVREIFPDARFLFLSRDGWDTCGSIGQWSQRLGTEVSGERHDWWGADRRKWRLLVEQIVPEHADLAPYAMTLDALDDQRAMAALEWIVSTREGLRLASEDPTKVLHVPYEDLCQDPELVARQIETFASLPDDPVFRRYATEKLAAPRSHSQFDLPHWLLRPFEQTQAARRAAAVVARGERRMRA